MLIVIAATVIVTLAVVMLALNLSSGEKQIKEEIPRLYSIDDPQFARTMGVALGPAIVGGNRFKAMQNGDEIFPAMLEAIRSAKKTITFETYIYWSEEIGKEFAEALAERAKAGVKVHVMIDWLGSSKIDPTFLKLMETAGVEVQKYHLLQWYNLARLNNRTHRKLLVVDGRIGFTGGVGIAGLWTGHAQDPDHWRDSHYSVEGPAAAECRPCSWTTGLRPRARFYTGRIIFPQFYLLGTAPRRCSAALPPGEARA